MFEVHYQERSSLTKICYQCFIPIPPGAEYMVIDKKLSTEIWCIHCWKKEYRAEQSKPNPVNKIVVV